jgi:hypothetical protein
MVDKIVDLLRANGVDLEDALFYLGTYLQDEKAIKND